MDELNDVETRDDTPETRFGARLRRVRVRAGVSVRRLAKELDRAHSTISDFENGRRLPGVEVVEQYEDYFGLPRGTLGAQRERARAERLESPRDGTVDENLGEVVCPYKGLQPFEPEDADVFFGRETQVQEVLGRLAVARFVAVVGASGSGKSSFVRAGLLAAITQQTTNNGATPRVALLTPGERPLDALTSAVSAATGDTVRVLADELRTDPDRLRLATQPAHEGGLVIAIDQFEELFTQCDDDTERRCFVDALLAAWRDPASHVTVIVALRADFYGRVAAYPELAATVVAEQTLIGPMTPVELRRAIELPAAQTGLTLQPGLADTMLEDLAGEPGALPLLSHALLETWTRRRRLMLTVSAYREAGGVRGAIAQTAERTLQSLPQADQAIACQIFLSLTDIGLSHMAETTEPTRRRVDLTELAACVHRDRDRVLGILAAARLVTIDERTVTVAHEALIRHWPRLRGWIETDRAGLHTHRRLAAAAREWDTLHREPAALFRGARLATANEWAAEHPDHLTGLERDFLTASRTLQQHELGVAKRRTRRLRALATGLAALTAIVTILAVWALDQRSMAQHETTQASSVALAASALPLLSSRPEISLLLAFEAVRVSPRVEARSSMLSALETTRGPGLLAVMRGHTGLARAVEFSPDRRTLATAGVDGTIRLWDVRTHRQLGAPLTGRPGVIAEVAFSPDGRTLASASDDNTIRLWDTRTHKQRDRLTGHTRLVNSVAFSPARRILASASDDGTIRLWDARTHRQLGAPLRGHKQPGAPLTINTDRGPLTVGPEGMRSVVFSRDGRTLASAGVNGTIRVWDVRTHRQLGAPLTGRSNVNLDVAFSPDGHTLASVSFTVIRLWDTRTHKPLGKPMISANGYVRSVVFSQDGRTLASANSDDTIHLWDVRTHKPLGKPLIGTKGSVDGVAFSQDGRTLASGSIDGTIRLWDARANEPLGAPLTSNIDASSVTFSPDGRTLASARMPTIRLWDVRTHDRLGAPLARHLTGHQILKVAFSPQGNMLATVRNSTISLWNVRTHKRIRVLSSVSPESVAFSPDGRTLASGGGDPLIRVWDVRTGKQTSVLRVTGQQTWVVAFSPDGRTLASGGDNNTVRLWDVRTRKPTGAPLTGRQVLSVAFSPDGRTVAAGDFDGTIRLWDVRTRKPTGAPLTGHTKAVSGVVFSPDGRTLASVGVDRMIRLWDVRTHKPLGTPLGGRTDPVISVTFSPDGRTLEAAGDRIQSWTGLFWRDLTDLQSEVCNLAGSGLSKTAWDQYAAGIPYHRSCP